MDLFELDGAERFFLDIERRFSASVLLDLGKLQNDPEEKGGDWSNVRRHCLVQAAAMEVIAPLLGYEPGKVLVMANSSLCHDWDKRMAKGHQKRFFSSGEKEAAERRLQSLIQQQTVSKVLIEACSPRFNLRFLRGEVSVAEGLAWYLDDCTKGDEIVPFAERIEEVSQRSPNPEPSMMAELAEFGFDDYWDSERVIGARVEHLIFALLRFRMQDVLSASRSEDFVRFLNEQIMARIEVA